MSTTMRAPISRAIAEIAAMSATFIIGFVGVSTKIIFVFGRMAARTSSSSDISTYVCSTPYFPNTSPTILNVPP